MGVDAGRENIAMARLHASGDPALPFTQTVQGEQVQGVDMDRIRNGRKGSLEYRHSTAEALRDAGEKFDVVCAMEVLEHVDEPGEFMKCLGDMVKVCTLPSLGGALRVRWTGVHVHLTQQGS